MVSCTSLNTNPNTIDGVKDQDSSYIQDEIGSPSPEPASRTIPEDQVVEQDRPAGKCAEIACSAATYLLTLLSLATLGAGLLGVGVEQYVRRHCPDYPIQRLCDLQLVV